MVQKLDYLLLMLILDPNKKFIYVEMAFFNDWWHE